jgi:hypothetical protein
MDKITTENENPIPTKKRSILRNSSNSSSQMNEAIIAHSKKHVRFGVSLRNNFYGLVSIVKVCLECV